MSRFRTQNAAPSLGGHSLDVRRLRGGAFSCRLRPLEECAHYLRGDPVADRGVGAVAVAAGAIAAVLAILWALPRAAPLLVAGSLLAVALTAPFVLFAGFGMCYLRIRRSMDRR